MKKYEIFSVFGIELEYIIVDINSFKIKNLSKIILKNKELKEKLNILNVDISYEMVQHVIELKTFLPELYGNEKLFTKNLEIAINLINDFLYLYNSKIVSLSMYHKLEVNNNIIGLSCIEIFNEEYVISHIEKCSNEFKNSYQMLFYLTLNEYKKYKYLNKLGDSGSIGLRKNKLSYNPIFLLKNYNYQIIN